jgi:ATP-binding cassette subfamily B protein
MDPTAGTIYFNGHDLRNISSKSLSRLVSVVTQDTLLFDGTLRDNIMLGNLKATPEQVEQAVRRAHLQEVIDSIEEGLDFQVGPKGSFLSGGQKQRLAIARAFLKDSPLLIMDEATSSLDSVSEATIQETIKEMAKDRTKTVIVIAHRLSTVLFADRILVIQNGRIAEQGTHDELMAMNGFYHHLYHLQFRHQAQQEIAKLVPC